MGLSQGSSNSLKIADFGMFSESIRLILIVTMNREVGLSQGSSNSLKIADFGMVSESIRLIITVTMNRESGAVPREL